MFFVYVVLVSTLPPSPPPPTIYEHHGTSWTNGLGRRGQPARRGVWAGEQVGRVGQAGPGGQVRWACASDRRVGGSAGQVGQAGWAGGSVERAGDSRRNWTGKSVGIFVACVVIAMCC